MKWFLRRAALLTATAAFAVAAIGTAGAQSTKAIIVAVLNFSNSSGVGGALLGNSASAATETQFIGSPRYDVVKKDTVTKTMADLTLTYPLGRVGIQQLATALEADGIITGDVVKVVKNPKTGQVNVTLRIEMTDRSSGELVNGAIVTGESGNRPDFAGSQDILLDEAVNKAAFAAVRSMNERILPEGTVYATSSREGQIEALLNIGSNSGVRQGMELIVLRNREQVGRLKITSVSPTDSNAAVIATTRGVQPEDKVRAVFRLENIPVDMGGSGSGGATIHRPKFKLGGVLFGAILLAGLSKLSHGKFSEGRSVRSAMAVSSGPFNGAPVPDALPQVPVIHVTWSPPYGVNQQDILAYAIYRVDQLTPTGTPVYVTGRGVSDFYDTGLAIGIPANASIGSAAGNINGLEAGNPTRYMIRTAYNSTSTTTGTTTTAVKIAEDVITTAATPLIPPPTDTTTLPADTPSLSQVTFNFKGVPGADRYTIQISDNVQFTNPDSYPKGTEGMVLPAPPSMQFPIETWGTLADVNGVKKCVFGGTGDCALIVADPRSPTAGTIYSPLEKVELNLLTSRFDFSAGQYYWRVGARSSRDDHRPENGGWVYGTMAPLAQAPTGGLTMRAPSIRRPGGGRVRPTGITPDVTPTAPTETESPFRRKR